MARNVFASSTPAHLDGQVVHGGAGILFLYGNYSGDVLNFDMAAEMLEVMAFALSWPTIFTVLRRAGRSGAALPVTVVKVLGRARRASLEEVALAAEKATRALTASVCLELGIIPGVAPF